MTGPFRQMAFDALPELPSTPHPFLDLETHSVVVQSQPFGRLRIAYREHGTGKPLLLVHGLMTSGYSFRYLLEPLGRRFRLLVPDLPGCGDSDKPDRPYHAAALGTFLGELQQALGMRGCDVVGNSLGGYLCMHWALSDPSAMRRLVNIHSPGVPMARLYGLRAGLKMPGARAVLDRLIRRDPERWAHTRVHYWDESKKSREEARVYGGPLKSDEGRRAFFRYLAETLDPSDMRAFARELERAPFPIPMLLLYATRDPMVPPRVGSELRELARGSELVWLDDCSHFMHVDCPERVAEIVAQFFDRQ